VYGKVTQNNITVASFPYAVKVWYWISLLNFWFAFWSLCASHDTHYLKLCLRESPVRWVQNTRSSLYKVTSPGEKFPGDPIWKSKHKYQI